MKQQFVLCCILPDVALGTTIATPSPEPRDDPPSCFSCSESSQSDATEVRITLLAPVTLPQTEWNNSLAVAGLGAFVGWPELRSFLLLQQPQRRPRRLAALGQSAVFVQFFRWASSDWARHPANEGVLTVGSCRAPAGVDIWIENVQGECVRIRERREIKVGHVAIGISDKVRVAADVWRWMSHFLKATEWSGCVRMNLETKLRPNGCSQHVGSKFWVLK